MNDDHVLPNAEQIRRLRRNKTWSQTKLAEEAKCAPATIVRLEKGTQRVRLSTLGEVARAFAVEVHDLVAESERPRFSSSGLPDGKLADETTAQIAGLQHQLDRILDALGVTQTQELTNLVKDAMELEQNEGFAAPQTERAYILARLLCQRTTFENLPQLYLIIAGFCSAYVAKGELRTAQKFVFVLCSLAKRMQNPGRLATARVILASIVGFSGKYVRTRRYLDRLLADPEVNIHHLDHSFADIRVTGLGYLAHAQYALGYPDQARESVRQAIQRAQESSHEYTLAWIWHYGAALHQLLREPHLAGEWAQKEMEQSAVTPFKLWRAGGMIQQGWAVAMLGRIEDGIAQMHQGIQAWRATGTVLALPRWLTLLAEGYKEVGRPEVGLSALDEALLVVERTNERYYEAETHRMRGELTLQRQPSHDKAEVEACFFRALRVARSQKTRSFELRAAVSLGRLWQSQGRKEDARRLLAPVYEQFTEGFDTADLIEAKQLLNDLSEGDQYKSP